MRPIRLFQFTDTHLFRDDQAKLCGVQTSDSLEKVIALARSEGWPPDVIVATGDLSQDETPESYGRFLGFFGEIGPPVHCLPGNHDIPRTLAVSFGGSATVHLTRWANMGTWQIVLLNTVVPKDNGGELADEELDFLDRTLAGNPNTQALICMHHNPVPVGSAWLDEMRLRNAAAFFNVVDRHANVRGIVFGHVHQEFEAMRGKVRLLASPSTSLQFMPKSESFQLDTRPPGFRRFDLHADGTIETSVHRLQTYAYKPDLTMRGY